MWWWVGGMGSQGLGGKGPGSRFRRETARVIQIEILRDTYKTLIQNRDCDF